MNNAGKYGRKWTSEIDQFIRAEVPLCKGGKKELLMLINVIFGTEFSMTAFTTYLTDKKIHLGLKPWQNNYGKYRGRVPYPLGARQRKKGYWRIKTEKGWVQMGRYVYEQSHPEYTYCMYDNFIFLDGDKENFDPENIEVVKKRELIIFQRMGGVVKGNPEVTSFNLARAKLKLALLDQAEKIGLAAKYENKGKGFSWRRLRSESKENRRKYVAAHPEAIKKEKEKFYEKYHSDPEFREHYLLLQRERRRKKRKGGSNGFI